MELQILNEERVCSTPNPRHVQCAIIIINHAQIKRQQQYAQVKRQYLCFLAVIIALSLPTVEHHTLLAFSCHYLICTIRQEQDAG